MVRFCIDCISAPKEKTTESEAEKFPVIALINPLGGNGSGLKVNKILESMDGCTTIDIRRFISTAEEAGKELKEFVSEHPGCRVIFCGGDGTVAWGFHIISSLDIHVPAAIFPLGTANEASKCTGWKNKFRLNSLKNYIHNVRKNPLVNIDVWNIDYNDKGDDNEEKPSFRPPMMCAFLSFGIDALIAKRFDEERRAKSHQPSVPESKLSYVKFDLIEMMNQSQDLRGKVELIVDGTEVPLIKPFRCLQVLNINSMSGGANFFGKGKCNKKDILDEKDRKPQRIHDGLLEVCGETSVHHYNMCFLGFSRARRFAQGKDIEIRTTEQIPMEVDGEPFMSPQGSVHITSAGKWKFVLGSSENRNTKTLFK